MWLLVVVENLGTCLSRRVDVEVLSRAPEVVLH